MTDESREVLKSRMIAARADMDQRRSAAFRLLENIYQNPRAAFDSMVRFKGTDADLLKRIDERPTSFGGLRGYASVGEYFSLNGRQERKISTTLAKELPAAIRSLADAEHKYLDLKRAYEGRDMRIPALSREKGGIEF